MNRTLLTLTTAATLCLAGASPALATEPATVTIVAWSISDPADIWSPPQTYFAHTVISAPDLAALDATIAAACQPDRETHWQIDQYWSGPVTDALIGGGVLYGPNNPQEDLIPGGDGVAYKVVTVAACPVVVPPVVPPVVDPPVAPPVDEPLTVAAPDTLAPTGAPILNLIPLGALLLVMGGLSLYLTKGKKS